MSFRVIVDSGCFLSYAMVCVRSVLRAGVVLGFGLIFFFGSSALFALGILLLDLLILSHDRQQASCLRVCNDW